MPIQDISRTAITLPASAAVTLTPDIAIVECDTTSAGFTVTLYQVDDGAYHQVIVRIVDADVSGNTVTITDGTFSTTLSAAGAAVTVVTNYAGDWVIAGQYPVTSSATATSSATSAGLAASAAQSAGVSAAAGGTGASTAQSVAVSGTSSATSVATSQNTTQSTTISQNLSTTSSAVLSGVSATASVATSQNLSQSANVSSAMSLASS
jgi:hypothetical protein